MLTEGVDSGKDFVGTAKDDLFSANTKIVIDSGGLKVTLDTIDSEDILDGGKGTDTLSIVKAGVANAAPTLTNIENVNVKFQSATAIDLVNATGVETVKVHNSTAVGTVDGIKTAAVVLENETNAIVFTGSTATALIVTATNVNDGTATPAVQTVSVDSDVADTATSLTLNVTDSMVDMNSTNNDAYTAVTINATGTNTVKLTDVADVTTSLTVTGKGFVDVSGAALTKVATVTVADGGIEADMTLNTATTLTVTTGAGEDTLTVTGANLKSINTGAGDDSVTVTSVLAATSVVTLGAGDDILTLAAAPAAGATLTAGAGTDTLAMLKGDYGTVAGYGIADLAKITGFEVLSITDILATGDSIDVSKIAGITSFKAAAGITTGNTATVSNLGVNSSVELAGIIAANGTLIANLKTDTTADTMTLKLNKDYTDNNDANINPVSAAHTVVAATVETLNVVSTGNNIAITAIPADYKADLVTNTLFLAGSNELTSLVVSGNQALSFDSTAAMTKLATIDGSSNTGGIDFDGSLADMTTATTSVAMTIKGSLTAANTLVGTGHADTIIGGSAADTIKGGLSGDTLTGNGGNDKFVYGLATESTIIAGQTDTITDFIANTVGNATTGAVRATTVANDINGDVIDLTAFSATFTAGIKVGVYANASDATTFISNANASDATGTFAFAALDSSTNKLYIDVNSDGTSDMYINLTGVTTIDAAAFAI